MSFFLSSSLLSLTMTNEQFNANWIFFLLKVICLFNQIVLNYFVLLFLLCCIWILMCSKMKISIRTDTYFCFLGRTEYQGLTVWGIIYSQRGSNWLGWVYFHYLEYIQRLPHIEFESFTPISLLSSDWFYHFLFPHLKHWRGCNLFVRWHYSTLGHIIKKNCSISHILHFMQWHTLYIFTNLQVFTDPGP